TSPATDGADDGDEAMSKRPFYLKLYRGLLRVFPDEFRGDFGSEMEEVFVAQHHEASRARTSLLRLWWETITGGFATPPREHLSLRGEDGASALRMMRRSYGFTLAAIVTLALGIGATTAIFSVVHAVLLKPLPYAHGDRLVLLGEEAPAVGLVSATFSVPE